MFPICADDEIDFRYMETFIKKMEDKGKTAVKYTLESEALNDNTLTKAEKDSIRIFNNGVFGYVDCLDEEHEISRNSIAIGMMGMK